MGPKKKFAEGGDIETRSRAMSGSGRLPPEQRPRGRNALRYIPSPDPVEAQGGRSRALATRAGSGGGGSPPASGREVSAPDGGERRPPSVQQGREVATRRTTQPAPQTVIDGDPRGPREVPNTRVTPQVEGPAPRAALPAPVAPLAESGARRAGRLLGRGLGLVGRAAGPVGMVGELAGSPAGETPEESRDPAAAEARAAAQMGTHDRAIPMEVAAAEAQAAREAPAPTTRARVAGAARRPSRARPSDSESDDLNARSLRAIRGEASDGSARDENIRRRMAEAGRETYATGGAVGKRDGLAIKGRTKARFC